MILMREKRTSSRSRDHHGIFFMNKQRMCVWAQVVCHSGLMFYPDCVDVVLFIFRSYSSKRYPDGSPNLDLHGGQVSEICERSAMNYMPSVFPRYNIIAGCSVFIARHTAKFWFNIFHISTFFVTTLLK